MAVTLIEKDHGGRCPFYRHRDAILLQVAADSGLSGAAVKVAIMVAQKYLNREKFLSGDQYPAWPSNATLAEDTGLNKTTVLAGIKQLETRGHMRVKRAKSKGRNRVNHYGFVIKPPAIGGENTTNKALKNGGEKTTNNQSDIGGEEATNNAVNGGEKPPLMVVKTPPDSIDEHLDDAGARSRAPQASESDDGSDYEKDQNHSQSDIGDSGAHERPQSLITASALPQETASYILTYTEAEWEEICQREAGDDPALRYELAGGAVDSDHGPRPTGGLEYCRDDHFEWNSGAFAVAESFPDWIDQDIYTVTERPSIVFDGILLQFPDHSREEIHQIVDVFVEALTSPERRAAALRHVWFLMAPHCDNFPIRKAFSNWQSLIDAATRRRAKAMRQPEASDLREVANGR